MCLAGLERMTLISTVPRHTIEPPGTVNDGVEAPDRLLFFSTYVRSIFSQDPLFSECVAFDIAEGVTVVGSGGGADIRLDGEEVLPRHAVITLRRGAHAGAGAQAKIGEI